jgi:hypothetical protein
MSIAVLQIYTEWANHYLDKCARRRVIVDLQNDMRDPTLLLDLVECVSTLLSTRSVCFSQTIAWHGVYDAAVNHQCVSIQDRHFACAQCRRDALRGGL